MWLQVGRNLQRGQDRKESKNRIVERVREGQGSVDAEHIGTIGVGRRKRRTYEGKEKKEKEEKATD